MSEQRCEPSTEAFGFLNRRARWVCRKPYHFAIARLLDEFYAEQKLKPPSENAMAFLREHECTFEPIEFMAQVLDAFYAEQVERHNAANREALAQNIRNWVEDLQPTDIRDRTTAELREEDQRGKAKDAGEISAEGEKR